MSVVEVDDRGRFTIPKEFGLRGARVVVISSGTFFVVVPIQGDPYEFAKDWLRTDKSVKDLKDSAERMAFDDAVAREGRRRETC
jgi:bifunctional DNA-binding transcriptional regulator/antitoxin component of YhaV-PrlF toxin-antitoxin module